MTENQEDIIMDYIFFHLTEEDIRIMEMETIANLQFNLDLRNN